MPYLKSIYVFNNYVDQNFEIDFSPSTDESFRHLILTGRNGSGKTITLKALNEALFNVISGLGLPQEYFPFGADTTQNGPQQASKPKTYTYPKVELDFTLPYGDAIRDRNFVYVFFEAARQVEVPYDARPDKVNFQQMFQEQGKYHETVVKNRQRITRTREEIGSLQGEITQSQERIQSKQKEIDTLASNEPNRNQKIIQFQQEIARLENQIDSLQKEIGDGQAAIADLNIQSQAAMPDISLAPFFLQYLFYKKKEQAYAIADAEHQLEAELTAWFAALEQQFCEIFEEPDLKLKHKLRQNRFRFKLPSGREFDFNQLAHGHSSFIAIMAEIMLRLEAHREQFPHDINPQGIVVIDEIENHLHISLQEKILPFLSKLFPKMQFIIATHSPAVIASVENRTIYDLSTHEKSDENLTGIPYGALIESYFGQSEYSIVATEKLAEAKALIQKPERTEAEQERLRKLGRELGNLSPDLSLDIYLEFEKAQARNQV